MLIEYRLKTPPASEPLTLQETKAWLKIDHDVEDVLIHLLITTARERCEALTGSSLMIQQWTAYLSHWPIKNEELWWDGVREGVLIEQFCREVPLSHGPVRQIDALTLYDRDGNAMLYSPADYVLDKVRNQLVLQLHAPLPRGERVINPIEITYTTGFETVPGVIKMGLLRLVAHLYEHRGNEHEPIPKGIWDLWRSLMRFKV